MKGSDKMKKALIGFILGGIIFGSIGIYGANAYQSNAIEYSPTDTSWGVTNVNDAINSLYSMKKELDTTKTSLNNLKGIGDATAANILKGKKAVVKGSTVTGTMNNHSKAQLWINGDNGTFYDNVNYTWSSGSVTNEMVGFKSKYSGYFTPDTTWLFGTKSSLAPLIKSGSTLLGVTGTYTSDATATAADILKGKTAYVNGSKITGTYTPTGTNAGVHTTVSAASNYCGIDWTITANLSAGTYIVSNLMVTSVGTGSGSNMSVYTSATAGADSVKKLSEYKVSYGIVQTYLVVLNSSRNSGTIMGRMSNCSTGLYGTMYGHSTWTKIS